MERVESKIRDQLAEKLHLIEPGLKLLDIEAYLPNPHGTRGFVDILALDTNGKYVLIELKRSNAASREALHELLKYLEAFKLKICAKDSEIRLLIVSTEWAELLVPFSSFTQRIACEVSGFQLQVNADHCPIAATPVTPVKLSDDRIFAPWHELTLYTDKESLAVGIADYEKSCSAKKIESYTLIIIKNPIEFQTRTRRMDMIMDMMSKAHPEAMRPREEILASLPKYVYSVYFACLQLTESECLAIIEQHSTAATYEEINETLRHTKDTDERLCMLHENAFAAGPRIRSDNAEIGYSAKFMELIFGEGAEILETRRYGTLLANHALDDEAIISDLMGNDGNRPQKYYRIFNPTVKSEYLEVKNAINRCLAGNPAWRIHILRILEEHIAEGVTTHVTVDIYNPSNLCLSLYLLISKRDENYLPRYTISAHRDDVIGDVFFGTMRPTGKPPYFGRMLREYYDNTPLNFLHNLNWGGYESRDAKIAKDIGMRYASYKVDSDDSEHVYELTDVDWEKQPAFYIYSGYHDFIAANVPFLQDIYEIYSTHWNGSYISYEPGTEWKTRT